MPWLARPVNAGMPVTRVSKAAAGAACLSARPSSQSRRPGPATCGSSISPLPGLAADLAASSRDEAVDRPCMWVGPPTTRRSAPATRSAVAIATGTMTTSCVSRRPAAMSVAMACVFPYIDS
jgi:hypothetical protein